MLDCIQSFDPRIHVHYSNSASAYENEVQHNCLYLNIGRFLDDIYEILLFCLSESISEFPIENTDKLVNFTFDELKKRNVSSDQLYTWSAPIDLIEDYEFYLNQSTKSDSMKRFFNCTSPRFGPQCQYQFVFDYSDDYANDFQTVSNIIDFLYLQYRSKDLNWTCYEHLECDYYLSSGCLDWTEICDGFIHCLNDGIDEQFCSQLEINECQSNEYRCANGQCISLEFLDRNENNLEFRFICIDKTDQLLLTENVHSAYRYAGLNFRHDEYTCPKRILTSSCLHQRHKLIFQELFSQKETNSISDDCWLLFQCILYFLDDDDDDDCSEIEWDDLYISIGEHCPDVMSVLPLPILSRDVYLMFIKNSSLSSIDRNVLYLFICTKSMQCSGNFTIKFDEILYEDAQLLKFQYGNLNHDLCDRPNVYRCQNSSICISIHRLMDFIFDCPYFDDENQHMIVDENFRTSHFQCLSSRKFIPKIWYNNKICDCNYTELGQCDDEPTLQLEITKPIIFQMICDGIIDDEKNETDETQCQQWPCNTPSNRCDGIWDCMNGEDELGCDINSPLNCSLTNHICVSIETSELICLASSQVNDGHVDCLGGVDESKLCRMKSNFNQMKTFHCLNDPSNICIHYSSVCDGVVDCLNGDDELICPKNDSSQTLPDPCYGAYSSYRWSIHQILCEYIRNLEKERKLYFLFNQNNNPIQTNTKVMHRFQSQQDDSYRCHRGVDIIVWLNSKLNISRRTCLCPPEYYGSTCQYQNQRITAILYFNPSLDSRRTLFSIVVSLIDDSDQRQIHSYDQFTYIYNSYCYFQYYVHLIYAHRPKNLSQNYSIHIDIYEQHTLNYRGSYLFRIMHSFLPVHRLPLIIQIPSKYEQISSCSNRQCQNGRCIHYLNNSQNEIFCQCFPGWSGRYCHIRYECNCAWNSVCIGRLTSNRSVCVCPYLRYGPRCLLTDNSCQGQCQNGGTCISLDYISTSHGFECLCPKGYHGYVCEYLDYNISLIFDRTIQLPETILIHFVTLNRENVDRLTIFQTISFRNRSILIHWSDRYNFVFIEIWKQSYYLAVIETSLPQRTIVKSINSSNHCRHVNRLVNQTIAEYSFVHRMKFYHQICSRSTNDILCFHDEKQFCLCQQHLADCFQFDFNQTFDCDGYNPCLNQAQCFYENSDLCQRKIMCQCRPCFFGLSCQLTTNGFSLSLDSILGYDIYPNISFKSQSRTVWISLVITIVFMLIGYINGILSLITFKRKLVCEVGCGIYLFGSSMTGLLMTCLFGLKFWILILSHMSIIRNQTFLLVQCQLTDWIIRSCLHLDQWLHSCVSIERAVCAVKGVHFNRRQSRQTAKWILIGLLSFVFASNVHDPIHRTIAYEENDENFNERIWCVTQYSNSIQTYDSFILLLHFFLPFILNSISTVILLRKQSQQQQQMTRDKNNNNNNNFSTILLKNIQKNKHLLIAPFVLIILAIPRLIISFLSTCMQSYEKSWLYLCGYFISFIPSMLTFIIFILPSKFYKAQFKASIQTYKKYIRNHLHRGMS